MTYVTAFRLVPRPVIGMVSVVNDSRFVALEDSLDWLETTGVLVERFDPSTAPDEVATRPAAQQMLSKGDACLPLILIDGSLALQGAYPSRTELARAVGLERREGRHTDRTAA